MASTVLLIMHMDNVLLFESLARCTAVWVADTPANAVLKNRLAAERENLSIAWFPIQDGESLETAAVRIAFSLDDHFNEHAQPCGYRSLVVFGARYRSSMSKDLAALDFKNVEPTVLALWRPNNLGVGGTTQRMTFFMTPAVRTPQSSNV